MSPNIRKNKSSSHTVKRKLLYKHYWRNVRNQSKVFVTRPYSGRHNPDWDTFVVPEVGFVLEQTWRSQAFDEPFPWQPSRLNCSLPPICPFLLAGVERRAETNPTFLEYLTSKYDFGPVKLPGFSRNGPQVA